MQKLMGAKKLVRSENVRWQKIALKVRDVTSFLNTPKSVVVFLSLFDWSLNYVSNFWKKECIFLIHSQLKLFEEVFFITRISFFRKLNWISSQFFFWKFEAKEDIVIFHKDVQLFCDFLLLSLSLSLSHTHTVPLSFFLSFFLSTTTITIFRVQAVWNQMLRMESRKY